MNRHVRRLCDLSRIKIPADMLEVTVDDGQIDGELQRLSYRYAIESDVPVAQKGDTVFCSGTPYLPGRQILLFTGTLLPGAENASQAAVGKQAGEVFDAVLAGHPVTLTVTRILHRTPVEVNDALIASLGLPGVETLSQYRSYLKGKRLADARMEQSKLISRYLIERMVEESDIEYDPAELEAECQAAAAEMAAQSLPAEMALPPEVLREAVLGQLKEAWIAEAFCESRNIFPDAQALEEDVSQMEEMLRLTGEAVPDRETLVKYARQNQTSDILFGAINDIIEEKLGGSHGNH